MSIEYRLIQLCSTKLRTDTHQVELIWKLYISKLYSSLFDSLFNYVMYFLHWIILLFPMFR